MLHFKLLIPFFSLIMAFAAPAQAGDGNATSIKMLRVDKKLVQIQQQHRQRIMQRFMQRIQQRIQLPAGRGFQALPLSTAGELELLAIKGGLNLDPAANLVQVSSELQIKSLVSGLSEVTLYFEQLLDQAMQVSDGVETLSINHMGYGMVKVLLAAPLSAGETQTLIVTRSGTPDCSAVFQGTVVSCQIAQDVSFSIGMAWQPMIMDEYTGQPTYPNSATIAITVPQPMSVAASGLDLGTQDNGDGTTTYSFSNDYKGTFAFSAADFTHGETAWGADKTVGSHVFSSAANTYAEDWRQATVDIMSFHASRYGPYDPPLIGFAEVTDVTNAAFGPLLTVFMPTSALAMNPDEWWAPMTLAHELGHQWFPGHVDLADSFSPWLAEGFATFAESEYTTDLATQVYGVDYRPTYRTMKHWTYFYSVPPESDVPLTSMEIHQIPVEHYFVLTYTKGALVVDMLRYLLGGDAPFFKALKDFRADHQGKGATAASFAQSLETSSGKDLTAFFDAWVYGKGYPTYTVRVDRSSSGDSYSTAVTITSDKDYALPLELDLITADGKPQRIRLPVEPPGTSFSAEIDTTAEVLSVNFNPEQQVTCRRLGAPAGDIHLNGEVDGIDLIYMAMVHGMQMSDNGYMEYFPDWADLHFDGSIDDQDLDLVLQSFGKKAGDK